MGALFVFLWGLWSVILILPASQGKDANCGRHLQNPQDRGMNGKSLQGQHSVYLLCEPWCCPGDCFWERNSAEGQCKVKFYLKGEKCMYKPRFFLLCCRHEVEVAKFGVLSALGSYCRGRHIPRAPQPTCDVHHPQESLCFTPAVANHVPDMLWDESRPWHVRMGQTGFGWKPSAKKTKKLNINQMLISVT